MNGSSNGGRSRALRELRESEELHRATLANISDAVFLTDDDGVFTFVCPNTDAIFGYAPDEVRNLRRIDALLGENLFEPQALAVLGEIRNVERDIVAKSGARRTVLVHVKKVAIKSGTVLYCCRDVTERKRAEEELRELRAELAHASRLALCGQLTATIAHEVRQPLTAIVANATAGLRAFDGPAVDETLLREILADIVAEGRLAADVTERLRALAEKRPLVLRPLDVNRLVAETLRIVDGDARRRRMTLRVELEPALPSVRADRVCLQQVLLNLALNAMDAMEEVAVEREVLVRTRRAGDAVEVEVSDNGRGVADAHAARLFQPFFTTKADGLGLGLTIARSVVTAHEGRIWLENRDGHGATFHVLLPSAPLESGVGGRSPPRAAARGDC